MKRFRVFIAMVCAVIAALSVALCASEDIAGAEENSCVGISVQKERLPARGVIPDPYNGHAYVDLGLPSGLKWATCNVGASKPWEFGKYFAWGETEGFTAEQVIGGERAFSPSEYSSGPAASISTNLTLEHDAARANLGGNWRMPTKAECQELIDNCNSTWTTDYNGTGVKGRIFTSKTNGNSVFFPAAGFCADYSVLTVGWGGCYWSASLNDPSLAWNLYFNDGSVRVEDSGRNYWLSVRAVCK